MLWWMQAAVYSLDFPRSNTKVRTLQLCALGSAVLQRREEEGKHRVRTRLISALQHISQPPHCQNGILRIGFFQMRLKTDDRSWVKMWISVTRDTWLVTESGCHVPPRDVSWRITSQQWCHDRWKLLIIRQHCHHSTEKRVPGYPCERINKDKSYEKKVHKYKYEM